MKKRMLAMIFAAFIAMSLVGCGSEAAPKEPTQQTESSTSADDDTTPAEEEAADIAAPATKDFEGDYTDTGDGTIEVVTPSGSSAEGTTPFLLVDSDVILDQIGFNAWEFDGSKISYIYVDGYLYSKEQLADTQMSIDLQGDLLAEGVHTVEVVQFDSDDPSGEVVVYKSADYEIKVK